MNTDARTQLISSLKDKEYRDAFVEEHISTGVPFQIKALRELRERNWTQKQLGERAGGMAAERVSILESPKYAKFTISTLLRIASAFDVGLMVRFVPFGELIDMELNLSPQTIAPLDFEKELPLLEEKKLEVGLPEAKTNSQDSLETRPRQSRGSAGYSPDPPKHRQPEDLLGRLAVG